MFYLADHTQSFTFQHCIDIFKWLVSFTHFCLPDVDLVYTGQIISDLLHFDTKQSHLGGSYHSEKWHPRIL